MAGSMVGRNKAITVTIGDQELVAVARQFKSGSSGYWTGGKIALLDPDGNPAMYQVSCSVVLVGSKPETRSGAVAEVSGDAAKQAVPKNLTPRNRSIFAKSSCQTFAATGNRLTWSTPWLASGRSLLGLPSGIPYPSGHSTVHARGW